MRYVVQRAIYARGDRVERRQDAATKASRLNERAEWIWREFARRLKPMARISDDVAANALRLAR
jgi:hypothetical protein